MYIQLTEQQKQNFINLCNKWLTIGLSTDRLDRDKCKDIIKRIYNSIGKKESKIIFCDSPEECIKNIKQSNLRWGNNRLGKELFVQLHLQLHSQLHLQFYSQLHSQLYQKLHLHLYLQLCLLLNKQLSSPFHDQPFNHYNNYFCGSWWCKYLAYYKFANHIDNIKYTKEQQELLNLWLEQAECCFWWFPFDNVVLISERPTILMLDDRGKLHNDVGPAMQFADGYSLYSHHGVRLEKWIVEQPENITINTIDSEQNLEVKRIMIEKFGLERYVLEIQPELKLLSDPSLELNNIDIKKLFNKQQSQNLTTKTIAALTSIN